jgi:hypothetical protein
VVALLVRLLTRAGTSPAPTMDRVIFVGAKARRKCVSRAFANKGGDKPRPHNGSCDFRGSKGRKESVCL